MGFSSFRIKVLIRVILLALFVSFFLFLLQDKEKIVTTVLIGAMAIVVLGELYYFVERTNRKLTRFLESVRYSDFVSGFAADDQLGKSFKDLNKAFNEVLEAFRTARSEKEEHWQYLNTGSQMWRC